MGRWSGHRRSMCWAIPLVSLLIFGCGGPDTPEMRGGAGGSTFAGTGGLPIVEESGGAAPTCAVGLACTCGDGRETRSTCAGTAGIQTCDCSMCPEFNPTPRESFDACGGKVFGQWRLSSIRYVGGEQLTQTNVPSGAQPIVCPAETLVPGGTTSSSSPGTET